MAVKELRESGWKVVNIPKYVNESNEAQIATSTPHDLGTPIVPTLPPCLKSTDELSPAEVGCICCLFLHPRLQHYLLSKADIHTQQHDIATAQHLSIFGLEAIELALI